MGTTPAKTRMAVNPPRKQQAGGCNGHLLCRTRALHSAPMWVRTNCALRYAAQLRPEHVDHMRIDSDAPVGDDEGAAKRPTK